ncbi:MAG: hypothetical protein PVJ67_04395 [Candidatus Pacearchaeota archaeon]|jgi:hypothetical protein
MRSNKEYWQETLERYRISKQIRKMRKKLRLRDLEKQLGYSRQYINNIQEIILKPSKDFINKLNDLINV